MLQESEYLLVILETKKVYIVPEGTEHAATAPVSVAEAADTVEVAAWKEEEENSVNASAVACVLKVARSPFTPR